jgi:hypothetical protein
MTEALKILADENIVNAVVQQLVKNGVDAIRLIEVLAESTLDPDVLEYCHEHGFALVTHDKSIRSHLTTRTNEGKEHAGVFIAGTHLQGTKGIGTIVNFIVFYNDTINAGAATLKDDVYNMIMDIN